MLAESPTCDTPSRCSAKRNLHQAGFFCHAPEVKRVSIVGYFNHWNPNATPMIHQPDGQWNHQYAFLVDGKRVLDPNATGKTRDSQGEPVSLVAIS